ncbi:hypothetical protein M413DRAFT_439710 [Hebeloma cylindrosporum]|uniref:Ino eighty subunit 1 n=1 Tax=Hebeloma cylindrosporum TaxID=76867 RepID=A0A0C3CV55_HEBCY|nr:hypothetical protein M413DRAFT_439710 [Hebeloma cylindrosporum h7]
MAASRRTSPTPRRVIPIKRADGEPLTRVDIQHDLLQAIFDDPQEVFSNPYPPNDTEAGAKLCFRNLYLKAILHSPKATKALKDKMNESSEFALDFAMLSLLVNVGRVNTTMSFFPEMKTAIRTYHPIPSLQRTNGNMQDAPRIKHILKTSLLQEESKNPPATPADIVSRCKAGIPPSTSITNLMFVFAHHAGPIGQAHFQGRLDFLDLFLRTDVSSASRARAFLWLCFNYLESPSSDDDYDEESSPNPFSDSKFSAPPFSFLTAEELENENRETAEDLAVTERLMAQRSRIVQHHGTKETGKASAKVSINGSVIADDEEMAPPAVTEEPKGRGKRTAPATSAKAKRVAIPKEMKPTAPKEKHVTKHLAKVDDDDDDEDDNLIDAFVKQNPITRKQRVHDYEHSLNLMSMVAGSPETYRNGLTPDNAHGLHRRHRYSPYGSYHAQSTSPVKEIQGPRHRQYSYHLSQPRGMLQQAWHAIRIDPLVDSDDEAGGDEYVREDYVQRLNVINRLALRRWAHEPPPFSSFMDTDPT